MFAVALGSVPTGETFAESHSSAPATIDRLESDACADRDFGDAAELPRPPSGPGALSREEEYSRVLRDFIVAKTYRRLRWRQDTHWRLTGPAAGGPCATGGICDVEEEYGVHPVVRIVYSPGVMRWLCDGRDGAIADGAMIVKEMRPLEKVRLEADGTMTPEPLAAEPTEWTVMVKASNATWDGWWWADYPAEPSGMHPPIVGRSAAVRNDFPDAPRRPDDAWYPTGNKYGQETGNSTEVFPYYGFGNYCVNCHASAERESTYSALRNLEGREHRYRYRSRVTGPAVARGLHSRRTTTSPAAVTKPFPRPHDRPVAEFVARYPGVTQRSFGDMWKQRFPAETYDHASALPERAGGPGQFLTSDQCIGCHDATRANSLAANMTYRSQSGATWNLSPYGEWRSSPMGLAGRDPVFFSQLQSETNRFAKRQAEIENTCLSCHGAMGQRQHRIDGKGAFSRRTVDAWRDERPALARYGGLARDGVSCAVCHHITGENLGQEASFTGRFALGDPKELFGPYDKVATKPMEHALGIRPLGKPWMRSSALCGSCHTIKLPVYDEAGRKVDERYEQTTYLEWLNSVYQDEYPPYDRSSVRSCQDCHMPGTAEGTALTFKVANIEDDTYPETDGRLPDREIHLEPRSHYARHTMVGVNAFLTSFFEQFPLLLGLRQIDYMVGPDPIPGLLLTRQAMLEMASHQTAEVEILKTERAGSRLALTVSVRNKAGHGLPSGVGFRRLFVELVVSTGAAPNETILWASGLTDDLGVIIDRRNAEPVAGEFFPGGGTCDGDEPAFQCHWQVIRDEAQVQIYQELNLDPEDRFTTSFLARAKTPKDNRLLPRGWHPEGRWAEETRAEGRAEHDPDYTDPQKTGTDRLRYEIELGPEHAEQSLRVSATLYYQAIPPFYLADRFSSAVAHPGSTDIERLYYLTSRMRVPEHLDQWKLRIAAARVNLPGP